MQPARPGKTLNSGKTTYKGGPACAKSPAPIPQSRTSAYWGRTVEGASRGSATRQVRGSKDHVIGFTQGARLRQAPSALGPVNEGSRLLLRRVCGLAQVRRTALVAAVRRAVFVVMMRLWDGPVVVCGHRGRTCPGGGRGGQREGHRQGDRHDPCAGNETPPQGRNQLA